jgi:hypothetical protein
MELIAASPEVQEVLQMEAGTKCSICRQEICQTIERHVCAVCEKTVHVKCLQKHLEDCIDYQVTFSRKRR